MEQAIVKLSQSPMPKPDVLVEAAEMLYRAGRKYPFATELLHRYLASGPVEAAPAFKAHYLLGLLLEKQGDKAGRWPGVPCFLVIGPELRQRCRGPASTQPSCSLRALQRWGKWTNDPSPGGIDRSTLRILFQQTAETRVLDWVWNGILRLRSEQALEAVPYPKPLMRPLF
jgi:hypothetical protein